MYCKTAKGESKEGWIASSLKGKVLKLGDFYLCKPSSYFRGNCPKVSLNVKNANLPKLTSVLFLNESILS